MSFESEIDELGFALIEDVLASAAYFYEGNVRMGIYWFAAAIIATAIAW